MPEPMINEQVLQVDPVVERPIPAPGEAESPQSDPSGSQPRGSTGSAQPNPWTGSLLSAILAVVVLSVIAYLKPATLLPFLLSTVATAVAGSLMVPILRRLKTGQVIRAEGPQSHLSKAGTPTMGGIYLILVGLGTALIWTKGDATVLAAAGLTLAYMLVGLADDWQVIRQRSNKGLSPRQKLGLQILIALLFCGWLYWLGTEWSVIIPFFGVLPLSWGFWILALFVLVGTNNAVNLTDGMDGLAAGTVAIALVALSLILDPSQMPLAIFAVCMSGACIGFLAHNRHQAQVFMGDTGSLGLGGCLAAIALLGNCLWALAVVGGVFVLESLSVIAQVSYFKYTKRKTGEGKRLLRMSPWHHHLELGGWSEIQVVGSLYLMGIVLAVAAWICRSA